METQESDSLIPLGLRGCRMCLPSLKGMAAEAQGYAGMAGLEDRTRTQREPNKRAACENDLCVCVAWVSLAESQTQVFATHQQPVCTTHQPQLEKEIGK